MADEPSKFEQVKFGEDPDGFSAAPPSLDPFRRAVVRGLAILLPPLLTLVIFLWIGNTVTVYLLEPMEGLVRHVIVEYGADIKRAEDLPAEQADDFETTIDGRSYRRLADEQFIPLDVYNDVRDGLGNDPMPTTAKEIYTRYVDQTWLQRRVVIPVFLCLFILALYLLGKFLAAGIGRFFWTRVEWIIHRLPLVRNVYGSVKQVTDFMISDPEVEYTRVVAIEYPRKGIWSLGMVTGDSMLDIQCAANEPVLSVLVPTSPMPFTGFTVTVKRSEAVDLNITVDQALQFIISCGVVVPPQQLAEALAEQSDDKEEQPMALSAPVDGDD